MSRSIVLAYAAAVCVLTSATQTLAAVPAAAPVAIPTTSASPPATSLQEVLQQPVYASSWAQFQALKAKAHPPQPGDWAGVWENVSVTSWEPGYPFTKRLPTSAPLKPEYRARYDKLFDNFLAGRDYDTMSDCIPTGYPRILGESMMEIAVTPEQTWMIIDHPNEVHRVYTDGRPHIDDADAVPEWEGDSIGFWDGDTLIVHTNHVRGLPMSYERNGPPSSDQLSGVEQWRKIDDRHIELQVTIYDPVILSAPWRPTPRVFAKIMPPYVPRMDYYGCVPGNVARDAKGGTILLVPGSPGYVDQDTVVETAQKAIDQLSK